MKTNHKIVTGCLLSIIVISVGIATTLLLKDKQEEKEIEQMEYNTISSFFTDLSDSDNETTDESSPFAIDWDGLLATNSDVIGWIRFENPSRINYPIVQRENDNQFYLSHSWTGGRLSSGAIFMHKSNSSTFNDSNSIIYGHRMINGSMFGDIGKYQSQSFMNTNPYFTISTPNGDVRTNLLKQNKNE